MVTQDFGQFHQQALLAKAGVPRCCAVHTPAGLGYIRDSVQYLALGAGPRSFPAVQSRYASVTSGTSKTSR